MAQNRSPLVLNNVFQVTVTWLWAVAFPLLAVGFLRGVLRINLATGRLWWREHQYLQPYVETILVGLLPLLFVWIGRENLSDYGIHRRGFVGSLILSGLVAAISHLESFLRTGEWISHASLGAQLVIPWKIWYAAWGIFANGPLEAFFVVWLITKTDEILQSENRRLSKGLMATIVLFGLLHILTTQSLVNAVYVFVIWLLLGLIFKHTRNAIGPMVGWTLINGMVWAFVELL